MNIIQTDFLTISIKNRILFILKIQLTKVQTHYMAKPFA